LGEATLRFFFVMFPETGFFCLPFDWLTPLRLVVAFLRLFERPSLFVLFLPVPDDEFFKDLGIWAETCRALDDVGFDSEKK
jgi:hypothetical protein